MKNTRKTKRTFKCFSAWDYEFEEQEFNRMSEQGWQLVRGGSFSQKYEYDDSVIYRYRLDYNNDVGDMARYDETFRDAGWERVNSTANGWHVFRKVYDPQKPDEEYEIYTDEASRVEMLKRWRRVCYIGFGMVLINFGNALRILDTSDAGFIGVGLMLACGMTFGMLIAGVLNINRMIDGRIRFFLTFPFLLLVALVVSAAFVLIQEGSYHALGLMVGLIFGAVILAVRIVLARRK